MFDVVHADYGRAWRNLAFDEALVRAKPKRPGLWLWRNPACVVLGRAQRAEREVDLAACSAAAVPVLRRGSGGGTVYHDRGNLNVTLVTPRGSDPVALLGPALRSAAIGLGLDARLGERGLFVGEAKLCGFAALRTACGALAHATMLCSTPPNRVGRYLAGAPAEPCPLDSVRSQVTSLAAHGIAVAAEPLVLRAMAAQLGAARHRGPNGDELGQQERLVRARYGFGPWHLTGTARTAEEESWTRTLGSISTG